LLLAGVALMAYVSDGAVLSADGLYRYRLTRVIQPLQMIDFEIRKHLACWICLNPSTADAMTDDATIRKIIGFSKLFGCRVIEVYNLFAYRSTDPKNLWTPDDPVGPNNDYFLQNIDQNAITIMAWGDSGISSRSRMSRHAVVYLEREQAVKKLMRDGNRRTFCLGRTQERSPRHPLRLAYSTPLEVFQ
jgi:hypothetical protein